MKIIKKDMNEITVNGFTVAEEMRILEDAKDQNYSALFTQSKS